MALDEERKGHIPSVVGVSDKSSLSTSIMSVNILTTCSDEQ
jgi:hypothetical protein